MSHRVHFPLVVPCLLAIPLLGCGSESQLTQPPPPAPPGVVTVQLQPAQTDSLRSLGDTVELVATVTVDGVVDTSRQVAWRSNQTSVVSSLGGGIFRAAGNGDAVLIAQVGSSADSASITVAQRAAAITVLATPDTVFSLGLATRFAVAVVDARGIGIPASFGTPAWASADAAIARAEALGSARAISGGTTQLSATMDGVTGQADLTVVPSIPLTVDTAMAVALQRILEDSMAIHPGIPGINAAVLFPDGRMWRGVTGISDSGARYRPNERLALGSTSKTVISALIMQLADQGVLGLDDAVGQWLPPFANVPPGVSLRQLLNNSSGVAHFGAHPDVSDSILADLNRTWQPAEIIQKFVQAPLFPPGQQYASSGTGYTLLGMVAEVATGGAVAQEFRARFWTLLGLSAPYEGRDEQPTGPVAAAWSRDAAGLGLENFNAVLLGPAIHSLRWMAGGIWTTAEDLALWGRALFGGTLFSPAMTAEMLSAIPAGGVIPGQIGAGLGVRQYNYLGREQWGHSGATSGANSLLLWDRVSGIVVAIQINASGPVHGSQHFWIGPALLQRALGG